MCIATGGLINPMYIKYGSNQKGLFVIGPSGEPMDNDSLCRKVRNDYKILFPLISPQGNSMKIMKDYKVKTLPTVFLIAPDKKIVEKNIYPYEQIPAILAKYKIDTSTVTAILPEMPGPDDESVAIGAVSRGAIDLFVRRPGAYSFAIVSLNGALMCRAFDGYLAPGKHAIPWDGGYAAGGMYVIRAVRGDRAEEAGKRFVKR